MARIVKKFADRKAEIIEAARQLFQTKEYDKTTMQEIIETLGIAKGTLYHYFTSKEQLLEAVIEQIVEQNIERLKTILDTAHGTALEKLKLLIQAGNMTPGNEKIVDQLNKPGNDAMHGRLLAATIIQQAPLYATLIKHGCDEGIFTTEAPRECAEFILSAIQFLTDRGIYPWTDDDLHRRITAFPRLIEQQLAAPRGSFQFLTTLIGR